MILGVVDFRNGARGRPSNRIQATVGTSCGVVAIAGTVFLVARPDS